MTALLISIAKYLLASGALYLFYRLVFRKHASFRESRFFLLGITLLALMVSQFRIAVTHPAPTYVTVENTAPALIQVAGIPVVSTTAEPIAAKPSVTQTAPPSVQPIKSLHSITTAEPAVQASKVSEPKTPATKRQWQEFLRTVSSHGFSLLMGLYLLVTLLFGANLTWQYLRIRKLKRSGPNESREGFTLVRHAGIDTPFSAGKTVFLPNNLNQSQEAVVLNHERWHIQHRHYIDVFIQEGLSCLFWFNPVQWLLRKELRSIHEYEADRSVLDEGTDLYRYQTIILEEVMGNHFRLANGFNQSFTKKRFIQMKNTANQRLATGHKLLLIPVFTLLFASLCLVPGQSQVVKVTKTSKTVNGVNVSTTSSIVIDTVQALPFATGTTAQSPYNFNLDSVRNSLLAIDPNRAQDPGYLQTTYLKSIDSLQHMVDKTLPVVRKLAASSNPGANTAEMNALLNAMEISANGQGVDFANFSKDFSKNLTQKDFKQLQRILENATDSLRQYRTVKVDRLDSPYLLRPVAISHQMMTSSFVTKLLPELMQYISNQMAGMMGGMTTSLSQTGSQHVSQEATEAGKMMGDMMTQLTQNLGQAVQGMNKVIQPVEVKTEEVVVDTVRVSSPRTETIHNQTLINIALNDPSREVRYTALQQIDDQAIILRIAQKDKDMGLRAEAVRRLNDPKILSTLAQNDPEPKIRVAALNRLAVLRNQK